MITTLRTRKPITMLQGDDLDLFPIWVFCDDEEGVAGMDETWVRPLDATTIPSRAYSLTIAADLKTASGFELAGFLAVDTMGGFDVSGVGTPFPRYGIAMANPSAVDRAAFATSIGLAVDQTFPITYRARAVIEGERVPREGRFA